MTLIGLHRHRVKLLFVFAYFLPTFLLSLDAEHRGITKKKSAFRDYPAYCAERFADLPPVNPLYLKPQPPTKVADASKPGSELQLQKYLCLVAVNGRPRSVVEATMTEDGKRYVCPVPNCGRVRTRSDHMRDHIKDKHHEFYIQNDLDNHSFVYISQNASSERPAEPVIYPAPTKASIRAHKTVSDYMIDILTKTGG